MIPSLYSSCGTSRRPLGSAELEQRLRTLTAREQGSRHRRGVFQCHPARRMNHQRG